MLPVPRGRADADAAVRAACRSEVRLAGQPDHTRPGDSGAGLLHSHPFVTVKRCAAPGSVGVNGGETILNLCYQVLSNFATLSRNVFYAHGSGMCGIKGKVLQLDLAHLVYGMLVFVCFRLFKGPVSKFASFSDSFMTHLTVLNFNSFS